MWKRCFFSNVILEKLWEMTRNPGVHLAWLWNLTISNFCHSFYMVITPHNFKILLSLLWLSHPTISKFYQPSAWVFFILVITLIIIYLEIGRNYLSITINIVSNTTVLVSQKVTYAGNFKFRKWRNRFKLNLLSWHNIWNSRLQQI